MLALYQLVYTNLKEPLNDCKYSEQFTSLNCDFTFFSTAFQTFSDNGEQ